MQLADMGADVVKVESPEGDAFRELPGFFGWNRGKRSISVDLKTPEGRAIVERLATAGDVFMENMRPGVAERLGVGWTRFAALNPRLVYCSVTAFGSTGPGAERPGFDPIFQALGGPPTPQGVIRPPQYLRTAPTDYYTAALATQAILAALFTRERTGRGQRVETSLLRGVLALQSGVAVDYPGKPSLVRDNPTYRLYQAGDGQWFFLAVGNLSFVSLTQKDWLPTASGSSSRSATSPSGSSSRRRSASSASPTIRASAPGSCASRTTRTSCRSSRRGSARSPAPSGSSSWPPTTSRRRPCSPCSTSSRTRRYATTTWCTSTSIPRSAASAWWGSPSPSPRRRRGIRARHPRSASTPTRSCASSATRTPRSRRSARAACWEARADDLRDDPLRRGRRCRDRHAQPARGP